MYPIIRLRNNEMKSKTVEENIMSAISIEQIMFYRRPTQLFAHYFATATASSNFTERSLDTPSAPIVTP